MTPNLKTKILTLDTAVAFRPDDITALVVAGGRGVRMGGVDKGLQPFLGRPLVQHALERLALQAQGPLAGVIVNANRHSDIYLQQGASVFGPDRARVVADRDALFAGPLAGFQAGLDACLTPLLLTVPCDSPLIPLDLAVRLWSALEAAHADVAVVHAPDHAGEGPQTLRSQPVFCLMRLTVAPALNHYLDQGGRKVEDWMKTLRSVAVPFDAPGDDPRAFANANTLDELRQLEAM
jgi:molybdopterin-guanine dinucleotide biosynthesis protein A